MIKKPQIRLWEPPLDDDEDDPDDDVATIDGSLDDGSLDFVSRYSVFCLCLVIGGMIAGAALIVAGQFVP